MGDKGLMYTLIRRRFSLTTGSVDEWGYSSKGGHTKFYLTSPPLTSLHPPRIITI